MKSEQAGRPRSSRPRRMKMGMIRQRKLEGVEMSKSGRVVEMRVNGAPLAALKQIVLLLLTTSSLWRHSPGR